MDTMHLDTASKVLAYLPSRGTSSDPLYMQLASALRVMVERGELRGGEALPSERSLMKATGYSRVTVRSAVEDLFRDGLIYKRPGAGSYVSPLVDQPLSVLIGFSADMQRRGARASSRLLEKSVGAPRPDEMVKLGLSSGETVVRLSRVRLADDTALAIERAVVPSGAVDPDTIAGSLYDALRASGNMPVRALQRLRAAIADRTEAELLGISTGSPVLHIERHAFLANGRAIEVTRSSYRGDRYDFIAELKLES
ncbi:GntR family transcriptional regulator [Devosia pacifica]|uniref:GntR family transcriptional regulator n=1 Tax=Devosia pacifica TaxID=1335967 RepID=A0A918SEH7_9HYPH|nr:GntR family transcriptional regulator [Devosia pacifica]GHA34689.1 GntR family transcriptional regulator [Devosia pacifica]